MKEELDIDFSSIETMSKIAKALSSNVRLQILDSIKFKPLNISEIAEKVGIPISSTALHIKLLEDADIVITQSVPGLRGSQRICGLKIEKIHFTILNQEEALNSNNIITEYMPIGNYFDCNVTAPCGIVSDTGFLSSEDSIHGFYSSLKHTAQLIWLTKGYLEYRFSNHRLKKVKDIKFIEFSFEVCSEAPGYNNNWKSDISIWINNLEIGFFTSNGDFGGRRGKLNPDWWNDNMTQFGILKNILINDEGTYIDGVKISDITLTDCNLNNDNFISFRIGVKDDAEYIGGFNLFGEKFGDFPQNICMRVGH